MEHLIGTQFTLKGIPSQIFTINAVRGTLLNIILESGSSQELPISVYNSAVRDKMINVVGTQVQPEQVQEDTKPEESTNFFSFDDI